jgi:hypothetical protein
VRVDLVLALCALEFGDIVTRLRFLVLGYHPRTGRVDDQLEIVAVGRRVHFELFLLLVELEVEGAQSGKDKSR